jgi:hypothetical protein
MEHLHQVDLDAIETFALRVDDRVQLAVALSPR